MFDSTPDVSHDDQIPEVNRRTLPNGKVEIKELFLVFFHIKRKKVIDIKQEILQRLELDGLSINDCLTLGYDNVTTMSGIHGGAQALIKNIDKYTLFNGSSSHSFNFYGEHSFAQNTACHFF